MCRYNPVADGAKPNEYGQCQEFDYCLEKVFGILEVQFASSTSQGGGNGRIDKLWAGICCEAAEDGITQEDNSCAEKGADVN